MKVNKAVYVTKHDIKKNQLSRDYQLYTSGVFKYSPRKYDVNTKDAGVQYNYTRDSVFCTCRYVSGLRRHQEVRYFNGLPKHVYTYQDSTSFTDIGVGSVKPFQRRKVQRIYLPETDDRGVGSSDLSSFCSRRTRRYKGSDYYDHKKTSSKCVGGLINTTATVLSEKLSPIIQTKSGGTSPKISVATELKNNVEIGSNTHEKDLVTISTQAGDINENKDNIIIEVRTVEISAEHEKENVRQTEKDKKSHDVIATPNKATARRISKRAQEAERVFSSDSLVQHVHNLENPSNDKQNAISIDLMENKLEREYRKMFSSNSKESKDQKVEDKTESSLKSTSILRRRFEALRRGMSKKEESKRNSVVTNNESSNVCQPSRRDVSIVSDPPSLEGRSYSSSKMYTYSKIASTSKDVYKKSYTIKKDWELGEYEDSDYHGVKGMFKLWGKRFNLDEDSVTTNSPKLSIETSRPSPKLEDVKICTDDSISKKEGKKFFFFKRKSKEKTKPSYKPKKGVTAGRCEVGDGLTIKIGAANAKPRPPEVKERTIEQIPEEYEEMLQKAWLEQFLSRSIESRHSVKVRWNNNAYTTSSSTIFEIMENVYKDTGVIFRSRSDITTEESSYFKSFTKQRVNFVQDVEAWMIPKFIPNKIKTIKVSSDENDDRKNNMQVRISDQKWFIDKSKAFAHKIEVVLNSMNIMKLPRDSSSEYLTIDIPKGFFTDSSTDSGGPLHTSNEEVYKIVEYESPESQTRLKENKTHEAGDHLKDIKVTVSVKGGTDLDSKIIETVIKTPTVQRDVAIQCSEVCVPKRCNVIGVGIITQKDMNRIRKPILKIQAYSDEDLEPSLHMTNITSKLADSYLQEYYRHWIPQGLDSSWCFSDTHIESCNENLLTTVNTKSCPNIYDDYQTSVISSCGTSFCSPCSPFEGNRPGIVTKLYTKFKTKAKFEPSYPKAEKRFLPKDSLEVYKKRKIYAQSNKSNWLSIDDRPYSVPSIESKAAQDTLIDCSKIKKSCCKSIEKPKKKVCTKHVSLPDCEELTDSLVKQIGTSSPSGILMFKGNVKCDICNKNDISCPKQAIIIPDTNSDIPSPRHSCQEPPPCPPRPSGTYTPPSRISCIYSPPFRSPCVQSPCQHSPLTRPPCTQLPIQPPCMRPPPCMLPPRQEPCMQPPPCTQPQPQTPCMHRSVTQEQCKQPSPPRLPIMQSPAQIPCMIKKIHKKKSSTCSKLSNIPMKLVRPTSSPCSSPPNSRLRLHSPPSHLVPPKCKEPEEKPCPSLGRPPCGSLPVSGIHLQSPPRSQCSTPKSLSSCASSASSTKSLCPSNPPPCMKKSPLCPPSPQKNKKSCKQKPPPCIRPPPCPPSETCYHSPPRHRSSPPCSPSPPKNKKCSCTNSPSPQKKPPFYPPPPCEEPSLCRKSPDPSILTSPCASTQTTKSSRSLQDFLPCLKKLSNSMRLRKQSSPPQLYCNSRPCCNPPPRSPPTPFSPPSPCSPPSPNSPLCPCSTQTSDDKVKCPLKPPCVIKTNKPSCKACRNMDNYDFPWPLENKHSNQSSFTSPCPGSPSGSPRDSKSCTFEKPVCPKKPIRCPSPAKCNSPPKISGIFLKMNPSTKVSLKECFSKKSETMCPPSKPIVSTEKSKVSPEKPKCLPPKHKHPAEQKSSEDSIIINIKKGTDSTEEIREGLNIKVQDVDGNTLYERKDYTNSPVKRNSWHKRPSFLNDVYKNSHVHAVSTSRCDQNEALEEQSNVNITEAKSNESVANLIEINFKLRVTQGEKTTEINMGNNNTHIDTKNEIGQTSQEVFLLKDEAEQCTEDTNGKNDVNIKIMIKNLKPKNKNKQYNEEFAHKITEKFQTVSTGYSDVLPEKNADNVFSIHRTTVNLASSNEASKTEVVKEDVPSEEFIERGPIDLVTTFQSGTEKTVTDRSKSESKVEVVSKAYINVDDIYKEDTAFIEKTENHSSVTETYDQNIEQKQNNTSDEPHRNKSKHLITKTLTRGEKKSLLKKIFEKASKINKFRNKDKMRQIIDMLQVILTDSRDAEQTMTSHELVKEMTYASLKPNYFRDSDSMNNYYKIEPSTISLNRERNVEAHFKNSTENASESTNRDSEESYEIDDDRPNSCMCRTLAAKLNMCMVSGACCCKKATKTDKETYCDLRTEEDYLLLNYKTIEYINVETQNSAVCKGRNISVHSRGVSGSFRNCDEAVEVKNEEIHDTLVKHKKDNAYASCVTRKKPCEYKKNNRNTMLGISDDDKVYLLNAKPNVTVNEFSILSNKNIERMKINKNFAKYETPADILQCYETKKAVLEIYAEKTRRKNGERLVAKLPKFLYGDESDIENNYEEFPQNTSLYKDIGNKVVMMSVKR